MWIKAEPLGLSEKLIARPHRPELGKEMLDKCISILNSKTSSLGAFAKVGKKYGVI